MECFKTQKKATPTAKIRRMYPPGVSGKISTGDEITKLPSDFWVFCISPQKGSIQDHAAKLRPLTTVQLLDAAIWRQYQTIQGILHFGSLESKLPCSRLSEPA
jgi:hypothetical protein